jgi:hypothetical protein
VLAGISAPTRSGVSNNFDALPRQQTYNDKFDIKYDQQIDTATTGFVRISHRKVNNFEPPAIPGDVSAPANSYVHVLNQQLAAGVTRTLSNNSLLEVRIGVSRTEAGKPPFGAGGPDMLDLYGITGLPTEAPIAGGTTQQSISRRSSLGRQSSNPQYQNPFAVNARLNHLASDRLPFGAPKFVIRSLASFRVSCKLGLKLDF